MEFGKHLLFLSPALLLSALLARLVAGRWAASERLTPMPVTWTYALLSALVAVALPPLTQAFFEGLLLWIEPYWARIGALAAMGALFALFVGKQPYFVLWQALCWGLALGILAGVVFPFLPATGPVAPYVAGAMIAIAPIFALIAMPASRQRRMGVGGAAFPVGGKWH
jgi:hypothetical protein